MTDITKRLAEALHIAVCNAVALMNRTPSREHSFHEAHNILRQALIDYADGAAAQEANEQGGEWVMVPREPTEAMLQDGAQCYEYQLDLIGKGRRFTKAARAAFLAMVNAAPHPTPTPKWIDDSDPQAAFIEQAPYVLRQLEGDVVLDGIPMKKGNTVMFIPTPQTSRAHDGKEFIDEPNAPLPKGKECLACNGTGRRTQVAFAPAPASGEVRYINCIGCGARMMVYDDRNDCCLDCSRDPQNTVNREPPPPTTSCLVCGYICERKVYPIDHPEWYVCVQCVEAATRTRQGEGIADAAQLNALKEAFCARDNPETELATNAADAEAYRAQGEAVADDVVTMALRRWYTDGAPGRTFNKMDRERMREVIEYIRFVPTAAPVPADEGEKK